MSNDRYQAATVIGSPKRYDGSQPFDVLVHSFCNAAKILKKGVG
jgi:hypothetical protein